MGKTRRQEPRNGQFKKLRGSNKKRMNDRQDAKAALRKEIRFTNRNPNTGFVNCQDAEPNEVIAECKKDGAELVGRAYDRLI